MRLFRHPSTIDLNGAPAFRGPTRTRRFIGILLTIGIALTCSYCAAVVGTSVSAILLPGNAFEIPGIRLGVPLVDDLQIELQVPVNPIEDVPVVGSFIGGSGGKTDGDSAEPPINILVMGTDHTLDFASEADPGRTDTIFVVSIDPESKTASILNFPRDTWIEVPSLDDPSGWTLDRINTAYGRGVRGFPDEEDIGPEYVIRTIEHNFGIPIKYWVEVDWRGFTKIVDSIGGIVVKVDQPMYDPISTVLTPFGGRLDPGWYVFNGEQALAYSRYRADSDLHRIERQHQVIFAVLDRLNLDQVLSDPIGLWDEYQDTVRTDINTIQIPGLALLAKQIGRDRLKAYSLGPAARDYVTPGGGAVLVLDPIVASKIIHQAMPDVFNGGVSVAIRNGTDDNSWATQTRDFLVAAGAADFFLLPNDEPLRRPVTRTVILNYTGDQALANDLAKKLGIPEDRVIQANSLLGEFDRDTAPDADIVVIAGSDLSFPNSDGQQSEDEP